MPATRMSRSRLLVAATAAAAAALLAGAAGAVESAEATATAKGPCKRGQVPVRANGRVTCRPAAAVLPKPRAIDGRLPDLRFALQKSPFERAGAAGKEAQRRMLAALPQVLKAMDGLARTPAGARRAGAPAACGPDGPETGSTNVQGLGVTLSANGATMSFQLDGQTFRLRFASCPKTFSLARCPNAGGDIRSSSSRSLAVTQEVWRGDVGNALVSRTSTTINERATVDGKVADDARLDYIDVDEARELFIVGTGGLVFRGTTVRRVRVDMRTGKYDPAQSKLVLQGDSVNVTKDDDDSFAATVDQAIKTFRSAEADWTSFDPGEQGFCATAVFSPRSDALKLKGGQTGRVGVYAKASSGGKATGARWTLLDQTNARFTPSSSRAPAPQISYKVVSSPAGARVRVTVKFTSTAGVGKDTWTQPLGGVDRYKGTFSGHTRESAGGLTGEWSFAGTVAFVRNEADPRRGFATYTIEKIDYTTTVTFSGNCSGRASESASLGRDEQPGNALHVANEVSNGARRYEINFTVSRPARAPAQVVCYGVSVTYPWELIAQVITANAPFSTDAAATRLQGSFTVPGTPITYTWNLAREG